MRDKGKLTAHTWIFLSLSLSLSLQQMKKQGYVHESETKTLRLRKKAFVKGAVPFNEEAEQVEEVTKVEGESEEVAVA